MISAQTQPAPAARPERRRSALQIRFVGFVACALLNACTTMHTVPTVDVARLTSIVKVGDTVNCSLRDSTEVSFKVTQVEPGTLVGESRRLPVADIASVEIKRFSAGKTVLLGVGLVAVGVVAYGLSNLAFMPSDIPY